METTYQELKNHIKDTVSFMWSYINEGTTEYGTDYLRESNFEDLQIKSSINEFITSGGMLVKQTIFKSEHDNIRFRVGNSCLPTAQFFNSLKNELIGNSISEKIEENIPIIEISALSSPLIHSWGLNLKGLNLSHANRYEVNLINEFAKGTYEDHHALQRQEECKYLIKNAEVVEHLDVKYYILANEKLVRCGSLYIASGSAVAELKNGINYF